MEKAPLMSPKPTPATYAICWMEMGEQPSSLRATSPSMAFLWDESMLEHGAPPGWSRWDQGLTLHHPTLQVTSPRCNTHQRAST